MSEQQKPVQHWLHAHVEAVVVHAAMELSLLQSLADTPAGAAELAQSQQYDRHGVQVLCEALAGMGILDRHSDQRYAVAPQYRAACTADSPDYAGALIATARGTWDRLGTTTAAFGEAIAAAEAAQQQAPTAAALLVATAWGHVWTAAALDMASRGLLSALVDQQRQNADLAARSQLTPGALESLLIAGEYTGILSRNGDLIELTEAARLAFGKKIIKDYGRWIEQRLNMERTTFWEALGQLAGVVRSGVPVSSASAPSHSSSFRHTFVQINRPLLPLLLQVARRAAQQIALPERPLRILELGAALGGWGLALAAHHPESRVVAVDALEALAETQRIVTKFGLQERYLWCPDSVLQFDPQAETYDIIILNEICHTLPPRHFSAWLRRIAQALAPGGRLLLADMILDETRTEPLRHLLSAIKLLVSGGGRLGSIDDYRQLLGQAGLGQVRFDRLATTDLIVASAE